MQTSSPTRSVLLFSIAVALTSAGSLHAQDEVLPSRRRAHRPAVAGVHGLVTSGHSLASTAGIRILMDGGNAADASVAVLATLNVTEPMMSGAGGNGFVTLYDRASDRTYSLSATGAAAESLDPNAVEPADLHRGTKAGIVPGLFGGWIALLERFGTKSLGEVLQPAIDYAENGHPIDPFVASAIAEQRELFERFPTTARLFLPEGKPPEARATWANPDLARTFETLVAAERKALDAGKSRTEALRAAYDCFYTGEIGQRIANFHAENDGLVTAEDLAAYEPRWTEPIHTTYRGYDVYTSPPTSRGGLEVAMQLNLIEGFDIRKIGPETPELLHLVGECVKLAKADVYHFAADPEFAHVPIEGLLSKEYAARRRKAIDPGKPMPYPDHGEPDGVKNSAARFDGDALAAIGRRSPFAERSYAGCTTSFSIADADGNVVACTPTLGSLWGTGVIVGDTGLFLNNGTRIGSTSPYPDDVNYVRGGQVPILNNSPIIVMRDGRFVLSLGTPGGESIGQTQFQVLLNLLDFEMGVQEAIEAPRIALSASPNFYKPGADVTLRIENRIPASVIIRLAEMGHRPQVVGDFSIGNMQGILRNPKTGTLSAGADPRRMMYAVGW